VDTAPTEVVLTFTAPVDTVEGGLVLFGHSGVGEPLATEVVGLDVIGTLPADLTTGSHSVTWRVVAADGHPLTGEFSFTIDSPPASETATGATPPTREAAAPAPAAETTASAPAPSPAAETTAPAPAAPTPEPQAPAHAAAPSPTATEATAPEASSSLSPVSVGMTLAQVAVYLGVLCAAGLIAFGAFFLPPDDRPGVRRRVRLMTVGAATLGGVGSVLLLLLTHAHQVGMSLVTLLSPASWGLPTGTLGLSTALVLTGLLCMGVPALLGGRWPHAASRAVGLLGGAVALGAFSLVGHTRSASSSALVISTDVLHVLTGAVWLGGLVGLGVVLSARPATPAASAQVLTRFSTVAAGLVALLGASGLVLGWRILGSWTALLEPGYGLTLLTKTSLVGVAVGIAAYNRYRLMPNVLAGGGSSTLTRAVRAETVVLVAVIALSGLLVAQDPGGGTEQGAAGVMEQVSAQDGPRGG
jgi:copper transport protein